MGEHVVCVGANDSQGRACNAQRKGKHVTSMGGHTVTMEEKNLYKHMIPIQGNVLPKDKHAISMADHILPIEERHL